MAEQWKEWRRYLDLILHDRDRISTKLLARIEERIGIDRVNIVFVLKIFVVIYLIVGRGREFVCNLIGFVYPAYASIKAIESRDKDDDTKWLTYWVVYAFFSLVEFFSDYLLSWIPFYWLLKCLFLIVCMIPFRWNGSTFIYNRIIQPFFIKHQQTIDSVVDSGGNLVEEATEKGWGIFRGEKEGDNAKDTEAEEPDGSHVDDATEKRWKILKGEREEDRREEDNAKDTEAAVAAAAEEKEEETAGSSASKDEARQREGWRSSLVTNRRIEE